MQLWQVIFVSIIEGLTEFLPVSSTFHLIFASRLLGVIQTDFVKLFEVFIQAGAILAVAAEFWRGLLKERSLMIKVGLSFVPTAVVGVIFHSVIKNIFFESPVLMLGVFVLVGLMFLGYEWWLQRSGGEPTRELSSLTWGEAMLTGVAQSLAIIPGVSRAGAVILGMMVLGINRKEATRYSFLLAVPTIVGAAAFDLLKMRSQLMVVSDGLLLLTVGFLVAFVSAFFAVRWFITYIQHHSLSLFGYYRLALGAVLIGLFIYGRA